MENEDLTPRITVEPQAIINGTINIKTLVSSADFFKENLSPSDPDTLWQRGYGDPISLERMVKKLEEMRAEGKLDVFSETPNNDFSQWLKNIYGKK